MTGFGRGVAEGDIGRVTVEIRSYNHRFLDVSVRMPAELSGLEDRVRRELQARFSRGRLNAFVTLEESLTRDRTVEIDSELAKRYHEKLVALARDLGVPRQGLLPLVVALPGVIRVSEAP